jgi:hypothetical protein
LSVRADCCERHRVDHRQRTLYSLVEPAAKLRDGIERDVAFVEAFAHVFLSYESDFHGIG